MGKHKHTSDDEDDNPQVQGSTYLVEVITQARVIDSKKKPFEYRVKWHGYTSDEDTWEPQDNVKYCKRLLKSFWKNVGKEHREHPGPPGTEYRATNEWIRKERQHFEDEMKKENAEKEARQRERERLRKVKAARTSIETDAPTQSRTEDLSDVLQLFDNDSNGSESDELPLRPPLLKSMKGKGKEVPRVASENEEPSSLKIKLPAFKKRTIETASTNKFAGMKISKKPTNTFTSGLQESSSASTSKLNANSALFSVASSSLSSSLHKQAAALTGNDDSSDQYLPPRPRPPAPAPAPAPAKFTPASEEAVDNLLATVMSFGGSVAQKPENLASQQTEPPKAAVAVPTGLKFTKRWTWTGELFIDTVDAADNLCNITIHSTSEPSDIGFRLGQILDSKHSIRFSKCYTRAELNLILQGLRKMDQIAKIGHRKAEDKEPLAILMKYLIQRNLTIASAAIGSLGHVAEMIIFPAANRELCERLNVPLPFRSADCLLIALMPWHIPPSKYDIRYLRPDELRESHMEKELEKIREEFASLASKPHVETAFRILGFDFSFVTFLPRRKYCVWSYQVDTKPSERGRKFTVVRPETKALFDVLSFLKAENVGYDDADARIIFVHVGSVRSIRKLPGIVQRRCDRPEVQFVTYGTHESVQSSMWGFHEIYPLGGIVTFTAAALLENPFYVAELIEQINKHPHWEGYILPSVLAVFVRLSCPGEDPLSVYTREPYHFGRILDLIEEGKVALMQSPGFYQGPKSENEVAERDKWVASQFSVLEKTPFQLLEECWSTFVAEYSNMTEAELNTVIESEIVRDLGHLQTQQAIRESYRRFVVIKAVQDGHINLSNDGFEWRTPHEFAFGDGFPVLNDEPRKGSDQPLVA